MTKRKVIADTKVVKFCYAFKTENKPYNWLFYVSPNPRAVGLICVTCKEIKL